GSACSGNERRKRKLVFRRHDQEQARRLHRRQSVDLTDIENDEVYLQVKARGTDGQYYALAADADVTNTPELRMTPVPDKPGFYRLVILPEEFFEGIVPEGLGILSLICYPLKPGFTYSPDTTPWDGIYYETLVPLLDCE
ncbi:MAG: hypothetical protein ACPG9S_07930, partial [Flavobacteriales bacterium]